MRQHRLVIEIVEHQLTIDHLPKSVMWHKVATGFSIEDFTVPS